VSVGRQQVRFVPKLLQKSFWGGKRKFLAPQMRFARGDMSDHIVSHKTTTELRIGATEYCSCEVG